MKLAYKRLVPEAQLPAYSNIGDSGMDIRSVESFTLGKGERRLVHTGIAAEIPDGYEIQVRPRSGMAAKNGVMAVFGTVDSNYRGEICVNLLNLGGKEFEVEKGDRIAQLVISPVLKAEVVETEELSETNRGSNGFGSTGSK